MRQTKTKYNFKNKFKTNKVTMVKDVDFKSAVRTFMSSNYRGMAMDEEGTKLAAHILNNINKKLIAKFKDTKKSNSDASGYLKSAQEAVKQIFAGDLQRHAVAESNRQILLAQTGIQSRVELRKSTIGTTKKKASKKTPSATDASKKGMPEGIQSRVELRKSLTVASTSDTTKKTARKKTPSATDASKKGMREGIRQMLAASSDGLQVSRDGEEFLSVHIANLLDLAATHASTHAMEREWHNLTPMDVKKALDEHVTGDLLRALNNEGCRNIALYHSGLIKFKAKKETAHMTVKVKATHESTKKKPAKISSKKKKPTVPTSTKGSRKISTSMAEVPKTPEKTEKTAVKPSKARTPQEKRKKSESKSTRPAKRMRTTSKSPKRTTVTAERGAGTPKKKKSTVPSVTKKSRQISPSKAVPKTPEKTALKTSKARTSQEKRKSSESKSKRAAKRKKIASKSPKRALVTSKRGAGTPKKKKSTIASKTSGVTSGSRAEVPTTPKKKALETSKARTSRKRIKISGSRRSTKRMKTKLKSPKKTMVTAKRGAGTPKKKKSTVPSVTKESRQISSSKEVPKAHEKTVSKTSKARTPQDKRKKSETKSGASVKKMRKTPKSPKLTDKKGKIRVATPSKKKKSTVSTPDKKIHQTSPRESKVGKPKAAVAKKPSTTSEKATKVSIPKEKKKVDEKKGDKETTLDFSKGIKEMCKQFTRQKVVINRDAIKKVNSVLKDVCKMLTAKSADSARGKKELTAEDTKIAITELFPKVLGHHAIAAHSIKPLCGHSKLSRK